MKKIEAKFKRVFQDLKKFDELRPEVLAMLEAGKTNQEVAQILVKKFQLSKPGADELVEEIIATEEYLVNPERAKARDQMFLAGVTAKLSDIIAKIDRLNR